MINREQMQQLSDEVRRLTQERDALRERIDKMAYEPHETPEELMEAIIEENASFTKTIYEQKQKRDALREALTRIRDCDWVITLPDRMDAVRKIAADALAAATKVGGNGN